MKNSQTILLALAFGTIFSSCKKEDGNPGGQNPGTQQNFKVSIENISQDQKYFASGVFNTPVGETSPGPATPGKSYSFNFAAPEGSKLSFATMFVASNDLFYSPDGKGIDLYNGSMPVSGDVTSMLDLWDAGTEVNEMPGTGPNQPMNQSGPNTGTDELGTVRKIQDVMDGFTYPSINTSIKATLMSLGDGNFSLTIENLNSNTAPIAPGVWVVHTMDNPLFTENMNDTKKGLEALAEDGNPGMLNDYLSSNSGIASPLAPGVWAVHSSGMPLFKNGSKDMDEGLEALAEDGDPSNLISAVMAKSFVKSSGVFNTPEGASAPGPLMPGNSYSFSFTATTSDYLSFATMLVQSNDLFFAPGDGGMPLWKNGNVMNGDVTDYMELWDVGTEMNEAPGIGPNQPMRQAGPNTGNVESMNVMMVNDGYTYQDVNNNIRVTVSLQ